MEGKIVVVSGPSGVGKSTLCREILKDPKFVLSVSLTTRPPRPGERDGIDYRFVTREEFERAAASGGLLEHAEVLGHRYGTPRRPLKEALAAGKIPLLDIDVQGAAALRKNGVPGVYIFIVPPTLEELRRRMTGRGTVGSEADRRMARAAEEMGHRDLYDYTIVNDDFATAKKNIKEILDREF